MDALIGLLGALVGGLLVVIGDMIRHRMEWRRENARRLFDASVGLATLYNRLCGELVDAMKQKAPLPDVHPERDEAVARFFITPGSEGLQKPAAALIGVYDDIRDQYGDAEFTWQAAHKLRKEALFAFEDAAREATRQSR
jgi:hypothetical protein